MERGNGGPGGIRTHGVLSEADYESAACNQHGVRPNKKTRSLGRPGLVYSRDMLHETVAFRAMTQPSKPRQRYYVNCLPGTT